MPENINVVPLTEPPVTEQTLQSEKAFSRVLLRIGLALTVFAFLPTLLALGFSKLASLFFPALIGTEIYLYAQQILILYVITIPLCMLIIGRPREEERPALQEKKHCKPLALLIFFCVAEFFAIAGNLLGTVLMNIVGILRDVTPENDLNSLLQNSSPITVLLVVVILGPIMEELLFRYAITRRLLPYGEKTAVLLTGLFFGLAHGNFYQFFYCFAIGALFSYIYVRTKSLLYPVLFHIVFNFIGGFFPILLTGMLPIDPTDPSRLEITLNNIVPSLILLLLYLLYFLVTYGSAIAGFVLFCIFLPKLRLASSYLPIRPERRTRILFCNVGLILFLLASVLILAFSLFS